LPKLKSTTTMNIIKVLLACSFTVLLATKSWQIHRLTCSGKFLHNFLDFHWEKNTHICYMYTHKDTYHLQGAVEFCGFSPVHESAVQVFCSLCHMILKQGGRSN
jgi:hypothetical protein